MKEELVFRVSGAWYLLFSLLYHLSETVEWNPLQILFNVLLNMLRTPTII